MRACCVACFRVSAASCNHCQSTLQNTMGKIDRRHLQVT